ncbi:3'-5' exonuclease [Lentzea sp. NPDC003310]|uniref:3'-5' exonuclease n=1 Tax=Lentzea sp. NPDC003310 TaxID=3154447 RepID=UPI0033B7A053
MDPQRDRITWIAAAVLADGEIKQRWSAHLADASAGTNGGVSTFADAAPALFDLLQGSVLVAHNAAFDAAFLREECRRAGLKMPKVPTLCTMRLVRRLELAVGSFSLVDCCAHFSVAHQRNHRADDDVEATAALLAQLLPLAAQRGWDTVDALLDASAPLRRTGRDDGELRFDFNLDSVISETLINEAGWRPDEESFEDALRRYGAQLRADRDAAYLKLTPDHRAAHELKDELDLGEKRASAWLPVLEAVEAANCPEAASTWIEYGRTIQGPKSTATRALKAFRRGLELALDASKPSRADVDEAVGWIASTARQAHRPDMLIEIYLAFGAQLRVLPPCGDCGDLASGCRGGKLCTRAELASHVARAPFPDQFGWDSAKDDELVEARARKILPLLAEEPELSPYARSSARLSRHLVKLRRVDEALAIWKDMLAMTSGRAAPVVASEAHHFARDLAAAKQHADAINILEAATDLALSQQQPDAYSSLSTLLGRYLKTVGRIDDAINRWHNAIRSGCTDSDTFERLSHTLEQSGSHAQAADVCEIAWSRFTPEIRQYSYAKKIQQRGMRCRALASTATTSG